MTPIAPITDPSLDLREVYRDHLLDPKDHGKLGAKITFDARVPLLRDYVAARTRAGATIIVPRAVHRSYYGFDYGMLGNDVLGDCVIAEGYHAVQHSRKAAGRDDAPLGDDALTRCAVATYSAVAGYVEGDPSTDQGTDPVAFHAYWQNPGIPLPDGSRDRIATPVQVLPHDGTNFRRGVFEFDIAAISLALPVAWQSMAIWDVGGDPNSDPNWQPGGWGGHQVGGVSFDAKRIAILTWGGVKLMTWAALGTYGQLVIFRVSQDQIGKGGVSETGVDYAALAADLPQL